MKALHAFDCAFLLLLVLQSSPANGLSNYIRVEHAVGQETAHGTLETESAYWTKIISESGMHSGKHGFLNLLEHDASWWTMFTLSFALAIGIAFVELRGEEAKAAKAHGKATEASQEAALESQDVPEAESQVSIEAEAIDIERRAKRDYLHAALCVLGLNISMLTWGIAQEYVMTHSFKISGTNEVEYFPSALFLVFANRMLSAAFSGIILLFSGRSVLSWPGSKLAFYPACSNLLMSWSQYTSLTYVSFALQTTVKSAQLLPVVIISSLRGTRHSPLDYAETLVIFSATVVFGWEMQSSQELEASIRGIGLLALMLMSNAATPHFQDYMFKQDKQLSSVQATFAMNFMQVLMALPILLATGGFFDSISFIARHHSMMLRVATLTMASTVVQYISAYTIKFFGPIIFTLIVTTRQAISVCLSALLFGDPVNGISAIAAVILFSTVILRSLRPLMDLKHEQGDQEVSTHPLPAMALFGFSASSRTQRVVVFFICAFSIHVIYAGYAIVQEVLEGQKLRGEPFEFPSLLVAFNHTASVLLAWVILKAQGRSVVPPSLSLGGPVFPPTAANLGATYAQHFALLSLPMPIQTLAKTIKALPVMLVGQGLGICSYTILDYFEGLLITSLVTFFVWDFQASHGFAHVESSGAEMKQGILLMLCYIVLDSFTPNLEDRAFQITDLCPAQLMFCMETFAAMVACFVLCCSPGVIEGVGFLASHPVILTYAALLALLSSVGCYVCFLTVKLFGPDVFTLLMISRQVLSMVLSVIAFSHQVGAVMCVCLTVVAGLVFTSALRRVISRLRWESKD